MAPFRIDAAVLTTGARCLRNCLTLLAVIEGQLARYTILVCWVLSVIIRASSWDSWLVPNLRDHDFFCFVIIVALVVLLLVHAWYTGKSSFFVVFVCILYQFLLGFGCNLRFKHRLFLL
jgi:hypothetical protein